MASYYRHNNRNINGNFQDQNHLLGIFKALNKQRTTSQFCDVILKVCGTQIYAHSNILAASSPYFGSILSVDGPRVFAQKQPQIIEIHIDSRDGDGGYGEAVSQVVDYMYSSSIILTDSIVTQIIEIAKIMKMESLLLFCDMFQNGETANVPKDVATCTTGLKEIAEILGSRTKTLKKADASTITEDSVFHKVGEKSIFKKMSDSNDNTSIITSEMISDKEKKNPSFSNKSNFIFSDNFETRNKTIEKNSKEGAKLSVPKDVNIASNYEDDEDLHIATNLSFENMEQNQDDASLLLAIGNVRPCVDVPSQIDPLRIGMNICDADLRIESQETEVKIQEHKVIDSFQNNFEFANLETSITSTCIDTSSLKNCSDKKIEIEDNRSNNILHNESFDEDSPWLQTKEVDSGKIDLDEISDLVKFHGVSSVRKSGKTLRGRPPGNRRGRGKKRGSRSGKPGRPRKIVKEPDSDFEFDDFIERLERGDSLIHNSDDESKSKINIKEEISTDFKSENGNSSIWKSKRIRTKPSILKKDYIMHSYGRKSKSTKNYNMHKTTTDTNYETSPAKIGIPSQRKSKSNLTFLCEKCDFSTQTLKSYRQHLKSHPETDPKYFVCSKCDFKTIRAKEYKLHKYKHMREEFICTYCENQSEDLESYQEHCKKHDGDNPYFCTECDSRFKTKNQLMAHKPKHQLFKPFICPICNHGFKWKHALKNHMITHNPSKDHLCDVCGYATAHKSQLKYHKLIHTGQLFKCPESGCQFQAIKRQNLKYHMVTHTHERPHQCEICGQSFSLVKNMRRHMLLHTDNRRYKCKVCSFHTTRYDKLKEHLFKLHNIGEQPGLKKSQCQTPEISQVKQETVFLTQDVTFVSDSIQINADGTISEESLQQIAKLARAQSTNSNIVNIQTREGNQVGEFPIIATLQFAETGTQGEELSS